MSPAEKLFSEHLSIRYVLASDDTLTRLYSILLESIEPVYIAFIKLKYFRSLKGAIQRYQDIPEQFFCSYNNDVNSISTSKDRIFISHKWRTREHPDPNRQNLDKLISYTKNFNDDTGIWWDFCCLPQRNPSNGIDDRSKKQKDFFKFQLSLIPQIILDTRQLFLWDEDGVHSGWCGVENIISNILLQDLNALINTEFSNSNSKYLVVDVANITKVHTLPFLQRISTSETANHQFNDIMQWFEIQILGNGKFSNQDFIDKIDINLILRMFDKFNLYFTNGADKEVVALMLFTIFQKLKTKQINTIQLSGYQDFTRLWHYIRGTYGNCTMPKFAYEF